MLVVASALLSRSARAAGPLIVNAAGQPLVWSGGTVTWNPDRGTLGTLANADAVSFVAANFAKWQAVPTAALAITQGAALPVDVTATNVNAYVGVCGDGLSPIVFDTNGTITDALLGAGASNSILGFAGPECGTLDPPVITEGSAILNGKFIDGIQGAGNPEISTTSFGAVFLHEFGHYLDLDHSQINLVEAFDASSADDDTVATMFPILINGPAESTLARDDEVAISTLYPTPSFASAYGRVTGSVLRSDGATPFQGAYVIARNVADPRHDAIGYASGTLYSGSGGNPALQGFFTLPGLAPGAHYTVEVEAIYPGFTGGSGVGPFSVPVPLPGPAEFWSGANEAASDPPDDPAAPGVAIAAVAGATTSNVNIVLNAVAPPDNDDCAAATTIGAFPFGDAVAIDGATSAADDPLQQCTTTAPTANANSVWYRFTAPSDGAVTVSTTGSSYDTVLSAYTGACGALAPTACDDDLGGGDVRSLVGFAVSGGTTYFLEVTKYGAPGTGTLMLSATFTGGSGGACEVAAPGSCVPGKGQPRTDCVTEWLVEPVPPVDRATIARRNVPNARLTCRDGDASCDFDGSGSDGGCTFHVAVCINNLDPRPAAAGCIPSSLATYTVQKPSVTRPRDAADVANGDALRGAVAALASPAGAIAGGIVSFSNAPSATTCTPFQDVRVPLGMRVLRTRAVTGTGVLDTDQLTLRCLPPASSARPRRHR